MGWPIQAYSFLSLHGFLFAWSPAHQPWNMKRGTGFSSSENEKHHNMYCTYEYINRYSIDIWIQYTYTAHQCPQHSGMARSISVKWHMQLSLHEIKDLLNASVKIFPFKVSSYMILNQQYPVHGIYIKNLGGKYFASDFPLLPSLPFRHTSGIVIGKI